MKILNLSILFLFFVSYSFSQKKLSVSEVDTKTYQQYLTKDWSELIKTGKKAKKEDIDFYYLNYRLGIAFYEQKKYAQAVKYFEKIYSQSPDDVTIQEYLYYSYLFSGRFDDARLLGSSFNRKIKEKLHIETEHPFIKALYMSAKHDINEDYEYISENFETVEQKTVRNQSWYNISLEHQTGKRVTIFHGFSHMVINSNISDNNPDLPPEYLEQLTQNEYYFSLKYHIKKGMNLSGGFHYLSFVYFAPNFFQTWGRRQISSVLYYFKERSFAGSLKLDKSFSIFNTGLETSVSNLNNKFQIQPAVSLKIYPFGNSTFFTETKGIYLIENDYTVVDYRPVMKQSIGFTFLKHSVFIPSVTYGDLINYTDYNAFIANNDPDKTKFRIESYLNFGLAKGRFNIFVNYQYDVKENKFKINNNDAYIQYINQTITGGIKWYFKKY